ncbi:hypothetical protein [Methylotuvimicrobium alcaliphilum]|uniref:Uncharacterized protein n=1 Tax=Methylotuvimicrobium alcaliphilum (strain DSM 19304 / NCIMB 14124 / VKM B-2133 / 20Z) TaxID=1091494 RepID=G4T2E8_META2|nr:hypothetical protein [Methylotuvimicrobium alcaliphilum]CCE23588.1 protein of unknown function [Methylotuvimicrobium alcaliphilum 20Z]
MSDIKQPNIAYSDQDKISGKRRTLVKGAIGAAPAILTLRSGAAFALNSAQMCVARANDLAADTEPAILSSTTDDVWLRKEVFCRTLTEDGGSGNSTFKVYNESDINTDWRHENYSGSSSGEIGLYDEFITQGGETKMSLKGQSGVSPSYTFTPSEPCYVLFQVDAEGNVVDYGQAVSGTPYITESCWASAMGA